MARNWGELNDFENLQIGRRGCGGVMGTRDATAANTVKISMLPNG
jgi:hypothetical protein